MLPRFITAGALAFLSFVPKAHATCDTSCDWQEVSEACSPSGASYSFASWPSDQAFRFVSTCTTTCCAPSPDEGGTCSFSPQDPLPRSFSIRNSNSEDIAVEFTSFESDCGTVMQTSERLAPGDYTLFYSNQIFLDFTVVEVDPPEVMDPTNPDNSSSGGAHAGGAGPNGEPEPTQTSSTAGGDAGDPESTSKPSSSSGGCHLSQRPATRDTWPGSLLAGLLMLLGLRQRRAISATR